MLRVFVWEKNNDMVKVSTFDFYLSYLIVTIAALELNQTLTFPILDQAN